MSLLNPEFQDDSAPSFGEMRCPVCNNVLYRAGEPKLPTAGLCCYCKTYIKLSHKTEQYETTEE